MPNEPMTLVERLRNPSRVLGGGLDEGRVLLDMSESANAHDGERVLRRSLINEIQRLTVLLHEANEACRSAHEIALRKGAETNWEAFVVRLHSTLANQHAALHPKNSDETALRDRPARNPGGMECDRCGEIFTGEEWHLFCAICVQAISDEIAATQRDSRPAPGGDGKE